MAIALAFPRQKPFSHLQKAFTEWLSRTLRFLCTQPGAQAPHLGHRRRSPPSAGIHKCIAFLLL